MLLGRNAVSSFFLFLILLPLDAVLRERSPNKAETKAVMKGRGKIMKASCGVSLEITGEHAAQI
jgi:hypothetical protein